MLQCEICNRTVALWRHRLVAPGAVALVLQHAPVPPAMASMVVSGRDRSRSLLTAAASATSAASACSALCRAAGCVPAPERRRHSDGWSERCGRRCWRVGGGGGGS